MRTSWILGGLICFAIGLFLTLTLIGAFLGIPLIFIGLIIFILGFIISQNSQKVEVHIHNHKK